MNRRVKILYMQTKKNGKRKNIFKKDIKDLAVRPQKTIKRDQKK
jgi:hypothetical protein